MVPLHPVSLFGAPLGETQTAVSTMGQASASALNMANPLMGASVPASAASPASAAPFGDLLVESIGQVDQLERQARSSIEELISGRGVDVHEAMIATEKAEMGFELVLSVRNKALAAYQQVMGMQF